MLHCPDEALKKALDRALGDRVDSIYVVDLLGEIETLAWVYQASLMTWPSLHSTMGI